MKKVKVIWTFTTDIICVPEIIYKNLEVYTSDFLEWVAGTSFDENINKGTCFGTEHYVYYLNDRCLSDYSEKVYIECENYVPQIETEIQEFKNMKKVYF